jgi:dTDP-glucose 4,6-dehydratase
MRQRRIVVSGGAGLLGSALCRALVARGDQVVVLDDLSTGRVENLTELITSDGLDLRRIDVTRAAIVDGEIDAVMHLASPASPADFASRADQIMAVNSEGTRNMLELAASHGAVFFLASTSEVYGDPLVHPQPESYLGNVNPTGPRAVYDEAKRFAEAMTMSWRRQHGADIRIVRIFNTYGPRMRFDDGRVVSNFIAQALRGKPLTVYGDGSQTRSLCYVDDEVEGFLLLLDSDYQAPVNIGNPSETTVLELAETVINVTGSNSGIELRPLPEDDPTRRQPDISLARRVLGWEPTVPLEDGLKRTVSWFAEHLGDPHCGTADEPAAGSPSAGP